MEEIKSVNLNSEVCDTFFKVCPFCGEGVNVFQVPENRYGKEKPFGWVIECKSMGCIFQRTSPNQSLKYLCERWNERVN